jgi:tRNA(Ile)-lysidine synthetase-like protein
MYKFINYVLYQINLKNLFSYNSSVTITISGGQDSNLLYFFIYNYRYQYNLNLLLVSCNHLWQFDSIDNNYNLTKLFFLNKLSFSTFVPFSKLKTENESRYWRYISFQRVNIFHQNKFLLIGHTNTDMVESFIFYLTRGSGSSLINQFPAKKRINFTKLNFFTLKKSAILKQNITPHGFNLFSKCRIEIIKPIQTLTRFEIYYLITFLKFPIWVDQTNLSLKYTRNRIRYQVLPLFRFFFNKNIDLTIHKFINILMDEISFIETLTQKLELSHSEKISPYTIHYTFSFFFSCPYSFQKQILLKSFKYLGMENFTFYNIEILLKILYTFFQIKKLKQKKIIIFLDKKIKLIISVSSFQLIKI